MQRRTLLGLGALLGAGAATGAFAGWTLFGANGQPLLLSARDDGDGRHYAVGFRLDGTRAFATPVTERCHDVVPHPSLPLALFVGRRPSTASYLIDTRDGRLLQTLATPADRHFNGHAVFHKGGDWLYATENDTNEPGRGVLGVYRLKGERLVRAGEHATHGVGPHQLLWMPDGETLVVANGGIRTEAESRVEMNLDAMDASLVLMRRDGSLVSRERLAERQNSVRHLAMNQYTASVAIHSELRLLALTAPRGNRFFIWDLDSAAVRLDVPLADCAGVGALAEGFVVSSGQGRCRLYDCRGERINAKALELPAGLWDNHLRLA